MGNFAMSYALKKRAQKMAMGGMCEAHGKASCDECIDQDDAATPPTEVAGSYAHGGLVERIMARRKAPEADEMTADYDYLDQIPPEHDADYTGENSGDHLGDETVDDEEHDLVRRIMRSRAKKDRNPRPA